MTTRTSVLWSEVLVGRPSGDVFFCPPGSVAIVKSVYVQLQTGTAQDVSVTAARPAGAIITLSTLQLEAWSGAGFECWVVLEPGDFIQIVYVSGPVHTAGFGTLLPG